jgi:hypothetical protein
MALNALRHSMGRFGGDEANVVFICSVGSKVDSRILDTHCTRRKPKAFGSALEQVFGALNLLDMIDQPVLDKNMNYLGEA